MSDGLPVDPLALREEVKSKYRSGRSAPRYRLVDRLNCRWPAVRRLAANA
jgi:hypothetical protein